jgi:diguanylate cyclase (GGDEF)-like protein
MDDYLFIYDILNDKYIISEGAVETFLLDDIETTPGSELFERVVYPEDYPLLQEDMEQITSGKSREHNLEYRWLGRNQKPVWISCRGQVVTDKQGRAVYLLGRIKEIAKRSKIDEVTGLYRVHSLKEALEQCRDKEHFCGYLLQIGIDNFKEINERYGQAFGDVVLSDTAQCIRAVVKDNGRVFRMDGDEMIVLVTDCDTSQENTAKEMYKEIRHRVDRHISDGGHHMFYTISAGYVYFDETAVDVDKLVEQAGFALHQAKLDGKNMSVCYTQEVYDAYVHTLDVQEELREDIENDFRGFELYYQPVVNIPKKKILGAEALIRWNSTKFGFMSPGQFIPMLEESGLIIPLGRWIAKTALEQCVKWQELVPGFRINVNLSFVQIKKSDALQDMLNLIRDLDIDKNMVMFEITESGELETGVASQVLRAFKDESIHLAIDDFGTGYSNLRYVKNMTFDLVKIDQSFIRNIRESQYDYLVVKQFTELAHSLNLTVCYEGVETKEDFECVLELNPDYIQGYYFSKPIPAGEFEEKCLNKPLDF